jgi:hypothetical protein
MSKKSKHEALRTKHATNPWPFILIAGGLVLSGIVVFAAWQVASPSGPKVPVEVNGAPSLKLDKDQVDLDNVRLGQTVEVTFNVANVGDKQLRFTEPPYVELVEGC